MAEEPTNAATFAALVEMAELPGGENPTWHSSRPHAAFTVWISQRNFDVFLPSSPHDEFWAIPQGAGRIGWNFAEIDACAKAMMGSLPMSIHTLVNSEDWKGGDIVRLDSALVRPGANDVAINYFFLKPVLEHSPHKVT